MRSDLTREVLIDAPPSRVWRALTEPAEMKQWMAEPSVGVEIETTWAIGAPIRVTGFHVARFENRGVVERFEPERCLRYTHLSSLSRLKDEPANYAAFEFRLEPVGERTRLTIAISNFATESIFKHLELYWNGTATVLKRHVEGGPTASPASPTAP